MEKEMIKLLTEIESLKTQIAELRAQRADENNDGGIGAMLVPIGSAGGPDVEIMTDSYPQGGSSSAKVLEKVKLAPMVDANNAFDTNIKFDIVKNDNTKTTTVSIGVYYL